MDVNGIDLLRGCHRVVVLMQRRLPHTRISRLYRLQVGVCSEWDVDVGRILNLRLGIDTERFPSFHFPTVVLQMEATYLADMSDACELTRKQGRKEDAPNQGFE